MWSGRACRFIMLKLPFQIECQDPATEELEPNLPPTNSKHLLKSMEMHWKCDRKNLRRSSPQVPSQSLTEVLSCCPGKNASTALGAEPNWALFIAPLTYAKWSFWFKIISCNAKQCPHCCHCWLAVTQWDARLPPSEHLLCWKSISAGLAL